ncbi:MAG: tetratricopeptide repeat protein, partial [Planctomycetota bacterium]
EAEAELKSALGRKPGLAEALYNLGLVAAARKKYADAVGHFRKALAANPKMAEAAGNMGHCLARMEKPDEAIAAYRKAIAIRPDYGQAHNNLAVALYRKKDYWGAWKHLQEAEKCGYAVADSFKRVLRKQLFEQREHASPGGSSKE